MKFVECFGYPRYWIDLISFAKQAANKIRGKFLEKNTKRKKTKTQVNQFLQENRARQLALYCCRQNFSWISFVEQFPKECICTALSAVLAMEIRQAIILVRWNILPYKLEGLVSLCYKLAGIIIERYEPFLYFLGKTCNSSNVLTILDIVAGSQRVLS